MWSSENYGGVTQWRKSALVGYKPQAKTFIELVHTQLENCEANSEVKNSFAAQQQLLSLQNISTEISTLIHILFKSNSNEKPVALVVM
jgi:hypothetical protein